MNITLHTTDNNCGKPFLELCGAEKMPHEIAAAEKESLSSAFRHLSNIANVPLGELVDYDKELARLKGELEKTENEIVRAQGKLFNQGFVAKAPKALIDAEKAKLTKFTEIKEKIVKSIEELESR